MPEVLMTPEARKARAAIAARARHNGPSDPHVPELRAELAAAMLEERIRDVVASVPALSASQRERLVLACLTAPGSAGDGA
jgi:hypothetical protein